MNTEQLRRNCRDAARGACHQSHPTPWDRIVASVLGLNLAANNTFLNCCSVLLDASCCQPCPRLPGSKSSTFRVGCLAVRRTLHEGGSKPPTPTNCLAVSAAPHKLGVCGSPSNCTTICIATSGWQWRTICPTAPMGGNPGSHPPLDSGNDADAFIPVLRWFKSTSRICAKHYQI